MNMHSLCVLLSTAANSFTSLPVVLQSSRRQKMFALKVNVFYEWGNVNQSDSKNKNRTKSDDDKSKI